MPLSAQLVLDVVFGILFVCLHLYRTRKRGHTIHTIDWSEWLDAFARGSAMYFIFAVLVLVVSSFRPFIKGVYIRLPWWSWSILCLVCVLAAVKLFQLTKAWLSVGIMTRPTAAPISEIQDLRQQVVAQGKEITAQGEQIAALKARVADLQANVPISKGPLEGTGEHYGVTPEG
jgi:hypothetical protein